MRELSLYGKHITSDSLCPSCKVESEDCCYQFFCLIFGTSAAQCEPVKRGSDDDGVPPASPMIKSVIWRKKEEVEIDLPNL